jgi:putative ABC transport system permease protein
MIVNYIIFAIRLFRRDKFHSILNIIGLSTGLACSIIILLYLQNELTYDRYHEKAGRIYRIGTNVITSGQPVKFAGASPALGPRLKEEYPEIEASVRIVPLPEILFNFGEKTFYEENIAFADPSFFYVFDHKFIHGDPKRCLKDPGNIVLTESLARKYFGHDDPIGNFIKVENEHLAEVTGVIEDLPRNSHLPLHGLISFSTIAEIYPDQNFLDWPMFELAGYTYLLVDKTFTLQKFSPKFPAFYDKYITEDAKFYKQVFEPILQKLTDIHYGTSIRGDYPLGNKVYIYAFFSVGILILALACINYINFATVQSAVRAKEIGVKKALGANRRTLILQTYTESLLSAFAALIIAFALVELIIHLPPFNELLNVELQHELINNPLLIVGSIALFIIIGILSGIYPAFYLSSIPPANALSGNLRPGKQGLFIRRSLVALQFIISITVVVVTLLMNDQINFMRNKDLGFKKENVVSIRLRDEDVIKSVPAIREELLKNPDIISVTTGNNRPGKPSTGLYRFEGQNGMEEHNFWVFWVDYEYLKTLGLELMAGRAFDKTYPADRDKAVIVNEKLVEIMGWHKPLGKRIMQGVPDDLPEAKTDRLRFWAHADFDAKVIGVVRDFNFHSLHNEIRPMMMRMQQKTAGSLIVRFKGESILKTMAFLEKKWKEINIHRPLIHSFLDEELDGLYKADQQQNKLIRVFSYICILISCLGLLALTSFSSARRTKEIAIRKAHGASAVQIVVLLFKEIVYLVVVASIIAIPISLKLIYMWLQNFAYKTDINIPIFLITAIAALAIAFLTASYHYIKVASANPVDSLRYE